jgi:tRNA(Ile)-lysidine synthase
MPNAPLDAVVARFRGEVDRLIAPGEASLGVAVSGGPDSLALLLLCDAAFPNRTFAATVDHGLRPESANEAAFVALLCQSMGVPHVVLKPDSAPKGNVSDWARQVRYRALEDWAADRNLAAILTGHHADDQLETVIMRLNRGSGVVGLSGIRARQGKVVRPLLSWRRSELLALVEAAGIAPVEDPSNRDDRFDRARLRKALAGAEWLDPLASTQSAAALAQADEALEWAAETYFAKRAVNKDGMVSLDPQGLPAELIRRLVLRSLAVIAPEARPRGDELARLIAGLAAGRVATLAGVLCTGGAFWLFTPAPPRRKI